jgi:hypothetical protein
MRIKEKVRKPILNSLHYRLLLQFFAEHFFNMWVTFSAIPANTQTVK